MSNFVCQGRQIHTLSPGAKLSRYATAYTPHLTYSTNISPNLHILRKTHLLKEFICFYFFRKFYEFPSTVDDGENNESFASSAAEDEDDWSTEEEVEETGDDLTLAERLMMYVTRYYFFHLCTSILCPKLMRSVADEYDFDMGNSYCKKGLQGNRFSF